MSLLAVATYDPSTAASKALSALAAQNAIDTTRLRCSFTAPAGPVDGTGKTVVMVRIRGVITGATTASQILLGVMEGSTVMGRAAPQMNRGGTSTTSQLPVEAAFLIGGLTTGSSHTWDAAVGVEFAVANSVLKYGGPDDASTNTAWSSISFEVWSCEPLIAWKHYDPATVADVSVAAAQAMTAIDATNLAHTFTVPTSGNVMVRMRGVLHGTTVSGNALHFGVLASGTIRGRTRTQSFWANTSTANPLATDFLVQQAKFVVPGLTPGASLTWQAALAVETAAASGNLSYGGPDDATQDNAYGGFSYEIWDTGFVGADQFVYAVGQVI